MTKLFAPATILTLVPALLAAQGTAADYERARGLSAKWANLAVDVADAPVWIDATHLWYRKSVAGGSAFVLVDATTGAKRAAFDHTRIAESLGSAAGRRYTSATLPFDEIGFGDAGQTLTFTADSVSWSCTLSDYRCTRGSRVTRPTFGGGGGGGGRFGGNDSLRPSPDGKSVAFVRDFNVWVRPASGGVAQPVSSQGSAGNPYTMSSVTWAPDSKHLAAYRVRPGYRRMVTYVESSPADQLQPRTFERFYAKPGDELDLQQPALLNIDARRETVVDDALFPNPYSLSRIEWRKDGRAFTFEYNQRGHQLYRVIEVDAASGKARSVVDESTATFVDYRRATGGLTDSGREFRYDLSDGAEMIWASERDGWAHLYLIDGATGRVKQQITKGDWLVRGVQRVDERARQIYFSAGGMVPGQDPYFAQFYRINVDGTGLTKLTDANGNHSVVFSPDYKYYVDTWSRVDLAPVMQLRQTSDQKVVADLEKGDVSALAKAGWRAPEAFVAKGRDGKTDIYGVIVKPTNFDAKRRYPVIESIYAGPQGSFVPKSFSAYLPMQALAELGFIVVQIDGMGTANRSKAFHDVAWKNLGDAGFPDRILWHKAVAAKYPWYDVSRVGIYGGSAGGQNSLGALLFHPEFYKVAVSFAGCHDNRMDKVWWNEQWMGYPIGPEYAAASNVVNAPKLQGKLLLVVGELDTNVDPSSTMQVVNALIRANKPFDLLVMPGEDHPAGVAGRARRTATTSCGTSSCTT